ncbi:MAG: hypothetical protein ACXW3G_07655 [Rhodoplanes sp.]|jgi:hypothetical protein
MTDPRDYRHDPYRTDPRPSEPRNDLRGGYRDDDVAVSNARTGSSIWAWLAGIAAVVFIIAIIYGFTNRDTQTAIDNNVPPARTDATTGTGAGGTTATAPAGPATGAGSGATGSAPSGSGGATTSGSGTTAPGQPPR